MLMTAIRSAENSQGHDRSAPLTEPLSTRLAAAPEGLRISRWFSGESSSRHVHETSAEGFLITVCLRATRLELRTGSSSTFDGAMRAGTLHVTGPGQRVVAEMRAPCDLVHLHVPGHILRDRLAGMGSAQAAMHSLQGQTFSDPLVEQLAKLLLAECAGSDTVYATSIAQTLLTRVLHLAQNRSPVGALPKWRLRRVQAVIENQLSDPLTLSDMAAAAGLSRMHFAAQFRAATGSSPHEYLLCQRIETAKAMLAGGGTSLAEIALSVGFLGQAHFTTVFKRLTGETPARWRRALREADLPIAPEPTLSEGGRTIPQSSGASL